MVDWQRDVHSRGWSAFADHDGGGGWGDPARHRDREILVDPAAIHSQRLPAGVFVFRDEAGDFPVFIDADIGPAFIAVEAEGLAVVAAEVGALAFLDGVEAGEGRQGLPLRLLGKAEMCDGGEVAGHEHGRDGSGWEMVPYHCFLISQKTSTSTGAGARLDG